jgi:hypothetical protein
MKRRSVEISRVLEKPLHENIQWISGYGQVKIVIGVLIS